MRHNIASLIWAFIPDGESVDKAERAVQEGRAGGIWLLAPQMPDAAATASLVNRLQHAAGEPLLVGVDAEAGMGLIMGGATYLPTAMGVGATGDTEMARDAGRVTAAEAAAVGVNVIAAPVLDVNINPANPIINTRSFGEDAEVVARMGVAFTEGASSVSNPAPVLTTAKHFPGHGDTGWDSHIELGVVDQPLERLRKVELPPFRAAIEAGVPLMMSAHVAYPTLDRTRAPATLSRPILSGLLRDQMGFKGAVVTDAMNMHAISENFGAGEAAVDAIAAGCDLIMTERWDEVHAAIGRALEEGRLDAGRLEEASNRVSVLKRRIFGHDLRPPAPIDLAAVEQTVGSREHIDVARRIANAAIRLVDGAVPPVGGRPLLIATEFRRRFGPPVERQVEDALRELGLSAEVAILPLDERAGQVNSLVERARHAGWVALLHFNRPSSYSPDSIGVRPGIAALMDGLARAGVSPVVVSLGSPYVLDAYRGASARLCAYSTSQASTVAALRKLLGPGSTRPAAL